MADELVVTLLPAKEGDCIHIAWGKAPDQKHMLIDAGRQWTWKHALKPYLQEEGITELELLVVTHVDRDHIDGMLALVSDPDLELEVKDIWFNTWDHLLGEAVPSVEAEDDIEHFGAKMGEELGPQILRNHWPWNSRFSGKAVELAVNSSDNLVHLGDLTLTLLSPDRDKLEALKPVWEKECKKAGLTPGARVKDYVPEEEDDLEAFGAINIDALAREPFQEDGSEANGTSIAFLLEYGNIRALLSGDAHAELLVNGLKSMGATPEKPLTLDAFKVPHHGSKYNLSRELLELMDCRHYLISTNGNYFKHPDEVAMARLVKYGTSDSVLAFNYKTVHNEIWDNPQWQHKYHYATRYPAEGDDGFLQLCFPVYR